MNETIYNKTYLWLCSTTVGVSIKQKNVRIRTRNVFFLTRLVLTNLKARSNEDEL